MQIRPLVSRTVGVVLAAAIGSWMPSQPAAADVIGNWDFSGGSFAALSGTIVLGELRTKPYYSAFGGLPGAPAVEFVSTGTAGIASPGSAPQTVMRVPNTSGYGPMGGLIAEFPRLTNATNTSLNRYTIVMDVLVRQSAYDAVFARDSGRYISLFQTAPSSDGDLFIDVRQQAGQTGADRPLGVAGVYGGDVVADQWHRIAWVAALDAATDQPRFRAYVDGQPAGGLVWDDLYATGIATNDSVKLDLVDPTAPPGSGLKPDGRFSIYTLGQISGGQLQLYSTSAFFLFNDNNGEVGEVFVANLQFRDDALSAGEILALGGATGGVIAVPEPSTLALAASCAALLLAWRCRVPSLRDVRGRRVVMEFERP